MALSKTLIALGQWVESHFPEKITASEVNEKIAKLEYNVADATRGVQTQNEYIQALVARVAELERKSDTFNSDMNKTKIMLMTQRQTAR